MNVNEKNNVEFFKGFDKKSNDLQDLHLYNEKHH